MSGTDPAPGDAQNTPQDTNSPPQQTPPPQPAPQPRPQPQYSQQPSNDLGQFFQQMGQQLSALPEQIANAVGERFPKPPEPPKTTETAQKKSGTRFSRWYTGE